MTKPYALIIGTVGFDPLPIGQWQHGQDNLCCCPYCSSESRVSGDNPEGVWDTRATDLRTGQTWLVHFPELHNRKRLRKHEVNRNG